MNTFRRSAALLAVGLVILAAVFGCKTTEPADARHTEAAPGPWKDVKVSIIFKTTDYAVNVTITVTGHPRGKGYVRKFELFDGDQSIGYRVFASNRIPSETFILDAETKKFTVEITSTELGRWVSSPRKVPRKK